MQFALSKPDPIFAGKTRLKVLTEIADQTGVISEELQNLPVLPRETAHVWNWFCDMCRGRTSGFNIDPIVWSDMWAYFNLYRTKPQRWEVEAIRALDDALLESRIEPSGKVAGAKALRQKITGPRNDG